MKILLLVLMMNGQSYDVSLDVDVVIRENTTSYNNPYMTSCPEIGNQVWKHYAGLFEENFRNTHRVITTCLLAV